MSERKPYAPLIEVDARAQSTGRAARTPEERAQKPAGAQMTQDQPPSVTPPGPVQRGMTAVTAMARTLAGGPINEVSYIVRFVLLVAVCAVSCTSTYTVGHGWFGIFGCPREIIVVERVEGPSRKELLKQGGKEEP